MPQFFGYTADGDGNWLVKFHAWPYNLRTPRGYGKSILEVANLWSRLQALYPNDMEGVEKWSVHNGFHSSTVEPLLHITVRGLRADGSRVLAAHLFGGVTLDNDILFAPLENTDVFFEGFDMFVLGEEEANAQEEAADLVVDG